jgi:hypothetical protein
MVCAFCRRGRDTDAAAAATPLTIPVALQCLRCVQFAADKTDGLEISAVAGSYGIRSASPTTQRIRTNVRASVVNETTAQASTIIAPATNLSRVAFNVGPPPVIFARSA